MAPFREGGGGYEDKEQAELPDWAKDIRVSFKIYFQTLERQSKELSKPTEELDEKSRELFYEFRQQAKDDLPVCVPLKKAIKGGGGYDVSKVEPSGYLSPNESRYYLPEPDVFYRVVDGVEDKYLPSSSDFVGYNEKLMLQHPGEIYIDVIDSRISNSKHFRPAFQLDNKTIIKIVDNILSTDIKSETRYLCESVKDEITLWQAEAEKQEADLEHKHAEETKVRLLNLLQVIKDSGLKLPDRVKGYEGVEVEKEGKVSFLLPSEKKIVKVPFTYRKKWHGKDFVKKYDFNSAEEAGDKEINNSLRLVDELLKTALPSDMYSKLHK
ncbi:MAG: hypothetical protein G01um101413_356 [Parcubacteria group bacterium Gr01-1014_13]|nr:MAG: hypothetical protein G01um101413_356 [Parcubacteria group bacterium Gr01-1014_13]